MQVWRPRLKKLVTVHGGILLGLWQSCWDSQASEVMELGRQPGGYRVQSWLVLLDAATGLLEAEQSCLQSTSCCCSQILSKLGLSVLPGPLLTVHLDQVKVLALCAQSAALHVAVAFPR